MKHETNLKSVSIYIYISYEHNQRKSKTIEYLTKYIKHNSPAFYISCTYSSDLIHIHSYIYIYSWFCSFSFKLLFKYLKMACGDMYYNTLYIYGTYIYINIDFKVGIKCMQVEGPLSLYILFLVFWLSLHCSCSSSCLFFVWALWSRFNYYIYIHKVLGFSNHCTYSMTARCFTQCSIFRLTTNSRYSYRP